MASLPVLSDTHPFVLTFYTATPIVDFFFLAVGLCYFNWRFVSFKGLHTPSVTCMRMSRRLTRLWDTRQCSMLSSRLMSFSQTVWGGTRFFFSHVFPSGVSSTPARRSSSGDVDASEERRETALMIRVTVNHWLSLSCCPLSSIARPEMFMYTLVLRWK